jgi:hypothetical protein
MTGNRVFWTALTNVIWTAIFLTIPIAMGLLAATSVELPLPPHHRIDRSPPGSI